MFAMPPAPLRGDLSLLRQGISIGWEFGRKALIELARVAELIETSVYEADSLQSIPSGVQFVLRNPPLRMGMFDRLSIEWDGTRLEPSDWHVIVDQEGTRSGSSITPGAPLGIPVGVRTIFQLRVTTIDHGDHRVRMEFHNVAVPPLVWMEFTDKVRA